MDDKLNKTLDKVVLLADQNPEFGKLLRKRLGISSENKSFASNDKIDNIEEYLGLDFRVDNQSSVIDYSFIKENDIKAQLLSDNREMMRYRYGTRYHSICFDEFCRYAHLQVEMLLNYFYDKNEGSDLDKIIDHIRRYNKKAYIPEDIKSLGAISYSVKLWAFKTEFNLNYDLSFLLDCLRQLRNDSSHRSPEKEQQSVSIIRQRLINKGMPLKVNGDVDYYKLDDNSKKIYNNDVKYSDWYKEYKYLLWLHEGSFDGVIAAIKDLRNMVKDLLLL